MKKLIAAALACAALAGCQTSSGEWVQITSAVSQQLAADTPQIVQVAQSVSKNKPGTTACSVFNTAKGYFVILEPLIPEPYRAAGDAAIIAGNSACNSNDLVALNAAWVKLQAATKAK